MSDRRLIVGEFDSTSADNGKLFALEPGKTKGIAIPSFDVGAARPAVGSTIGQGYYDTLQRQGFVWTGSGWQGIAPNPILSFPTEADLLANTAASTGAYGTAGDTGSLFIKVPTGWRQVGIKQYATVTDLLADDAPLGTLGQALDAGSFWEKMKTGWRCALIRPMRTTADVLAWVSTREVQTLTITTPAAAVGTEKVGLTLNGTKTEITATAGNTPAQVATALLTALRAVPAHLALVFEQPTGTATIKVTGDIVGDALTLTAFQGLTAAQTTAPVKGAGVNVGDQALAADVDVTYVRTLTGWKPITIWSDTEANIRAATWAMNGQDAISTDTGRTFTRLNGTWVEEPIAHFTTEALLLAANLPNGTLAWADDTNVVFTRAAGAWKRLQGPQISVGTTAPSTPGVGDLFYNTDKKLTEICTKTTPAVEWAIAGGEADLKTGVVTIPAGAGTWFELVRGLTNKSGLYRVEIESGDGNNGSIITFEHHAMTNTGSQLRLVESDVLGTTEPTVDMVGVDWLGGSHRISARTSTRAGMTGWKLNVTVRALDGTDISGVVIGTVSATEPGIKLDVPKVFPQLDSGKTAGQIPVWNGSRWVPGSTADSGAPRLIGRKDLAFHHYQSDIWESVVDRYFKPGKMGAKVDNLVMVVMSVSVFKYHDGSVKLNSRIGVDASGTNANSGWMEYNAAGTSHPSSGTIERTAIIKVVTEDMKVLYDANSFATGGSNGDRQGWGYIAAWDMGPEITVDL